MSTLHSPTSQSATPQSPGLTNWVLVILLGIIWGAAFMGVSVALRGYGLWTVTAGRLTLGALVLVFVAALMGQPIWRLGGKREWAFTVALGLAAIALPFTLLSWGLQHVPSAFAGVAMGTVPLLVLPLVYVFSPEEGIGPRRIIGVALGFLGLLVLVGPGALSGEGSNLMLGRLACVGAAACYAIGSVTTRRAPKMPPVAFAGATLAVGAAAMLPIALVKEGIPEVSYSLATLSLVFVAVFPTALAAVMRVWIITTAGSLFMSTTSYMVPAWAVIYGIVLLGEDLSPQLFIALGLILVGIGIAQSRALLAALRGPKN